MDVDNNIEFENSEKVKKSCYRLAFIILALSCVKFNTDSMSVFSLSFDIDQFKIVSILQLLLLVSFIFYLLHNVKYILNIFSMVELRSLNAQAKADLALYEENWGPFDDGDEPDSNTDPDMIELNTRSFEREQIKKKISERNNSISNKAPKITSTVFLFLLVAVTLLRPSVFDALLAWKGSVFRY